MLIIQIGSSFYKLRKKYMCFIIYKYGNKYVFNQILSGKSALNENISKQLFVYIKTQMVNLYFISSFVCFKFNFNSFISYSWLSN